MHFSLETDYAIRAVLHLVSCGGGADRKEIGAAMHIYNYQLSTVIAALQKRGIVAVDDETDVCRLLRHPDDITMLDIVVAVEGDLGINRCLAPDCFCSRGAAETCPVRAFYKRLQQNITDVLRGQTIAGLLGTGSK